MHRSQERAIDTGLRRSNRHPIALPAWIGVAVVSLVLMTTRLCQAQTPSPLQEWQYSSGVVLQKMFEPAVPDWQVILGAAAQISPVYAGAERYHVLGGPVINIRYSDVAFLSSGEGLGANLLQGANYRAGIAVGYDLGRKVSNDEAHLHGLGDLKPAPTIKVFATYAISKAIPVVLRADVHEILGGADGLVAEFGGYVPLPGSSQKLVMFAGPSVTIVDRGFAQHVFGISETQAAASRYAAYRAHAGWNAAGFGFSATRFVTSHWLINADAAITRLLGSAQSSPITQSSFQGAVVLSMDYQW
jgi:outer membrane scaffolding protein for murein synthesis (MipA/OmpV family)